MPSQPPIQSSSIDSPKQQNYKELYATIVKKEPFSYVIIFDKIRKSHYHSIPLAILRQADRRRSDQTGMFLSRSIGLLNKWQSAH